MSRTFFARIKGFLRTFFAWAKSFKTHAEGLFSLFSLANHTYKYITSLLNGPAPRWSGKISFTTKPSLRRETEKFRGETFLPDADRRRGTRGDGTAIMWLGQTQFQY